VGADLVDALTAVGHDQGDERTGPGDHSEREFHQVEECLRVELRGAVDLLEVQQVHQAVEDAAGDQDRGDEGGGYTIAERGWPPLIWTRPDGYKFCADPAELQAYEIAVIRGKLTEIRRFITGTVAPHAVLQPKGRWIKHLNTQLNSVESTLDVIADFTDA
jgi:hypothetical protein